MGDGLEPMMKRILEQLEAPRVVEELICEVWVALDDPDIPQHLIQHARGAPGSPLRPQLLDEQPRGGTEQPGDDFAVGE